MPLYLISRKTAVSYDEHDAIVVRAKNEQDASKFIPVYFSTGYQMGRVFKTTITKLKSRGKSEVILASFNAG